MPSSEGNTAKAARPAVSPELAKLRRGEMTLDDYIEHKAELATRHLEAVVSAEQLEIVRDTVRAQLRSNPRTMELLRRATTGERSAAR